MIPVRAYFRRLTNYLRPLRPRVVLLSFVLLSTIALQLVNPQLIKRFIDGAIDGRDASGLGMDASEERQHEHNEEA